MKRDLVGDIRARLSVEEVVGSYLDLKRSGDSYKALSPFKSEKTPSLIVTSSKEIWKDFSSGKGGDLFKFVMEYEGVDFREALHILALKAGLNPDEYSSQRGQAKNRNLRAVMVKVLTLAADFYARQFKKSSVARQYVKGRGFGPQVVEDFQIGYAPGSWHALHNELQARKVPTTLADLAGLIKNRQGRWGDFFGDRLMIPLSDPQGQVIGFTGRLLADKEGVAKYVNSKQTILYNKSKHVFGYFQAKEAIRKEGFVLVVEGNLDVVACHQAGYKQTVAAGGTALTADHLKIIGRLTRDVRLAFDGDAAGTAAMERSLLSAQQAKVSLSIVSLPEGNDPDDLIKKNPKLWDKIVQGHQPAPEWLYGKYSSQLDLKTAEGKRHLTDVMLPVINCLNDEVEKDHYLKKLESLGISRTSLDKKMAAVAEQGTGLPARRPLPARRAAGRPDKLNLPQSRVDKMLIIRLLLGLLLIEPRLRNFDEKRDRRIQAILEGHDLERELYNSLKETDERVDSSEAVPDKLGAVEECVGQSLDVVKTTEKGMYFDCDLTTKERAVEGLVRQLDNLQAKEDIKRKLSAT